MYLVIADHIVDQAICLCLFGTHVMISFCVYLNHAERLTSICCQMLIQLSAAESAVHTVSEMLLRDHLETCVTERVREGDAEVIDEAMQLIKRFAH